MSEVINLNNSSPAAPSGDQNVTWQKGASTGTDPSTGSPIYPVSAYVPLSLGTLGLTVDGGGSTPTTGVKGFLTVPYNCTITSWSIIGDQSGSASVDIWFVTGGGPPPIAANIPTSGNKISASAPVRSEEHTSELQSL